MGWLTALGAEISKVDEDIGAFDAAYNINMDDKDVDTLVEWLAMSCTSNFILLRRVDTTIAGGYSNNLMAWNNGMFSAERRNDQSNEDCKVVYYQLRLSHADDVAFRIVCI